VIAVDSFMKKEVDSGKAINVHGIQSRVSEATGVPLSIVKRVLKEHEHNKRVGKGFGIPARKAKKENQNLYRWI